MSQEKMTMRDVFLNELYARMRKDKSIFFLSADFGSPALDAIRKDFGSRFINVGIAEQNLVNVATGLGLEGFSVYAFGISTFLAMRAFEQIRIDLALQAQLKNINVNLIGVGAGVGYDVSGPTHHCLEDISIIRTLPNITFFSPSDWVMAKQFVDYSLHIRSPKYLRFDSKAYEPNYTHGEKFDFTQGFYEARHGQDICIISTGYMTRQAIAACRQLEQEGVHAGLIDLFLFKPLNVDSLVRVLKKYRGVFTAEEGFLNKGGLDTMVASLICAKKLKLAMERFGFQDRYTFKIGGREYLHNTHQMLPSHMAENVKDMLREING